MHVYELDDDFLTGSGSCSFFSEWILDRLVDGAIRIREIQDGVHLCVKGDVYSIVEGDGTLLAFMQTSKMLISDSPYIKAENLFVLPDYYDDASLKKIINLMKEGSKYPLVADTPLREDRSVRKLFSEKIPNIKVITPKGKRLPYREPDKMNRGDYYLFERSTFDNTMYFFGSTGPFVYHDLLKWYR